MNKYIFFLTVIFTIVLSGCKSASPVATEEKQSKISIQAFVDGSELIYIKEDKICIQHLAGTTFVGKFVPISINGTNNKWSPVWNKAISEEHQLPKEATALPSKGEWDASNMKVDIRTTGFGTCEVINYPNSKSDHILAIKIDDTIADNPHWYFINIDWE